MKILYLHQHFQKKAGATRSYEFSKYFLQRGHDVTLITGTGKSEQTEEGMEVLSTETKYDQKMSKTRRIAAFGHFMIGSFWKGLTCRKIDVIYATSTPLTVGLIGLLLSKVKRVPLVFEVRDVWPDVPIALGYITNPLLIQMLTRMEKMIYNGASEIIALSPAMKRMIVAKDVAAEKITVVENVANNELVANIEVKPCKDKSLQQWIANRFVVVHPGTMGQVNGLQHLLTVASNMKKNAKIGFLLIGEGSEKAALQEQVTAMELENVKIVDAMQKEAVFSVMKQCDIGAMSVKNERILWDNSANKFFDFLAVGLPVVLNYQGWQHEILQESGAGRGFLYHDIAGYCEFLQNIAENEQGYRQAQVASKNLSERYDVTLLSERVVSLLEKMIERKK
ncbi:glycosyltransferase family 4 protein [Listeria booriae]|uniref:Glycosyltransferase family 4 protein n=1 Tax=Listeria booriae TaxID=1552123 RepID=A0A841Y5K4_9LIST|nr:glycosyltransferase family 4 protein [Listeria booriae]MBC1211352.1 glycosyltransferase family 4 protein [Listeria booriae]MBC1317805.1 glycosyltransferase family 4 protein [Listeria booriae]MBC1552876.1 glycosyltransferase family 4 protein [Listeria booriae]